MGAGIIVVRGEYILALIKKDLVLDLPKGTKDETETIWECAQRETYEECNLWFELNEMTGRVKGEGLTLYITKWKGGDLKIPINEKTQEYEHIGWEWVTPVEFNKRCLPYLKPYITKQFLE